MTTNSSAATKQATVCENEETPPVSDSAVAQHLVDNPDFFYRHPRILSEMELPHNNGSAVSLVERQVAILRDRSIKTRHKLGELIEAAKDNDILFTKTQALVLSLLSQTSLDAVFNELEKNLKKYFAVESVRLLLICNEASDGLSKGYQRSQKEAESEIPGILSNRQSICGKIRPSESSFIFSGNDTIIGSVAIACRHTTERSSSGKRSLLLAVAHHDPSHYNSDTGTLFIDYLGDILLSLCQRH